jgi:hypothetical protein
MTVLNQNFSIEGEGVARPFEMRAPHARGHAAPSRFRQRENPRYSTANPMRSNRGVAGPTGQSVSIE